MPLVPAKNDKIIAALLTGFDDKYSSEKPELNHITINPAKNPNSYTFTYLNVLSKPFVFEAAENGDLNVTDDNLSSFRNFISRARILQSANQGKLRQVKQQQDADYLSAGKKTAAQSNIKRNQINHESPATAIPDTNALQNNKLPTVSRNSLQSAINTNDPIFGYVKTKFMTVEKQQSINNLWQYYNALSSNREQVFENGRSKQVPLSPARRQEIIDKNALEVQKYNDLETTFCKGLKNLYDNSSSHKLTWSPDGNVGTIKGENDTKPLTIYRKDVLLEDGTTVKQLLDSLPKSNISADGAPTHIVLDILNKDQKPIGKAISVHYDESGKAAEMTFPGPLYAKGGLYIYPDQLRAMLKEDPSQIDTIFGKEPLYLRNDGEKQHIGIDAKQFIEIYDEVQTNKGKSISKVQGQNSNLNQSPQVEMSQSKAGPVYFYPQPIYIMPQPMVIFSYPPAINHTVLQVDGKDKITINGKKVEGLGKGTNYISIDSAGNYTISDKPPNFTTYAAHSQGIQSSSAVQNNSAKAKQSNDRKSAPNTITPLPPISSNNGEAFSPNNVSATKNRSSTDSNRRSIEQEAQSAINALAKNLHPHPHLLETIAIYSDNIEELDKRWSKSVTAVDTAKLTPQVKKTILYNYSMLMSELDSAQAFSKTINPQSLSSEQLENLKAFKEYTEDNNYIPGTKKTLQDCVGTELAKEAASPEQRRKIIAEYDALSSTRGSVSDLANNATTVMAPERQKILNNGPYGVAPIEHSSDSKAQRASNPYSVLPDAIKPREAQIKSNNSDTPYANVPRLSQKSLDNNTNYNSIPAELLKKPNPSTISSNSYYDDTPPPNNLPVKQVNREQSLEIKAPLVKNEALIDSISRDISGTQQLLHNGYEDLQSSVKSFEDASKKHRGAENVGIQKQELLYQHALFMQAKSHFAMAIAHLADGKTKTTAIKYLAQVQDHYKTEANTILGANTDILSLHNKQPQDWENTILKYTNQVVVSQRANLTGLQSSFGQAIESIDTKKDSTSSISQETEKQILSSAEHTRSAIDHAQRSLEQMKKVHLVYQTKQDEMTRSLDLLEKTIDDTNNKFEQHVQQVKSKFGIDLSVPTKKSTKDEIKPSSKLQQFVTKLDNIIDWYNFEQGHLNTQHNKLKKDFKAFYRCIAQISKNNPGSPAPLVNPKEHEALLYHSAKLMNGIQEFEEFIKTENRPEYLNQAIKTKQEKKLKAYQEVVQKSKDVLGTFADQIKQQHVIDIIGLNNNDKDRSKNIQAYDEHKKGVNTKPTILDQEQSNNPDKKRRPAAVSVIFEGIQEGSLYNSLEMTDFSQNVGPMLLSLTVRSKDAGANISAKAQTAGIAGTESAGNNTKKHRSNNIEEAGIEGFAGESDEYVDPLKVMKILKRNSSKQVTRRATSTPTPRSLNGSSKGQRNSDGGNRGS